VAVIAGIPIRVHVTLALLLAWIAISYSAGGLGPAATLLGVLLVVAVFAIIAMHELAHALVARRFGVRTREILLLPIGGMASLEHLPERPSHELAIALVGPLVNLVLAAILWLGITLAGGEIDVRAAGSAGEAFATQLLWINVALAVFNLIPAFPMDGGRALRALLAMRLGRERATAISAGLGKMFAVGLAVFGLLFNPWLVLIAAVVWFGAGREAEVVRLRAAITDVPASAAMNRRFDTVTPDESLGDAARLFVETGQGQIPIVDHGEAIGVLTRTDVADGIARGGAAGPVGSAPHHEAITVAPGEPLDRVFDRLVRSPDAIAVVVDRGAPVGIITAEQLATFVAMQSPVAAAAR